MEFKGTQGHWEFITKPSPDQTHEIRKVESENGISICMIRTNNEKQAHANGKLIATAPLMLEALQKCYTTMKAEGEDLPPELEEAMIDAEYIIDLAIK
jgi:hypothetical protein